MALGVKVLERARAHKLLGRRASPDRALPKELLIMRAPSIAMLTVLMSVGACERSKSTPTAPAEQPAAASAPAPAASEAVATPGVAEHMKAHFMRAAGMRDAVIAGDLEALRKDAQWMAEHELSAKLPDTWRPHVERMQSAAKKALDARELPVAAQAVAETAAACGACHAALGGPKLALGAPPVEGSGASQHMARHQWSAARMWDALATPSEEAWLKAAEVMADAPLGVESIAGSRSVAPETKALARTVHDIAEKSRAERDTAKWTASYAQSLATCASCHRALGQKPAAPSSSN
jgi:hypothetical protein